MSNETLWQKFHVGQGVWCIYDSPNLPTNNPAQWKYLGDLDGLSRGEIYTISNLYLSVEGHPCCELIEIKRTKVAGTDFDEPGYSLARFEPVREQNIELFRQMCRDAETKVSA